MYGGYTVVVADHASGYRESPQSRVRYAQGSTDQDHIRQWRRSFAFTASKRSGRDWNLLTMSSPGSTQNFESELADRSDSELLSDVHRLESDGKSLGLRSERSFLQWAQLSFASRGAVTSDPGVRNSIARQAEDE